MVEIILELKELFEEQRRLVLTGKLDSELLPHNQVFRPLKFGSVLQKAERLPSDGSVREYYRIYTQHAHYVAMKMEPFSDLKDKLPFLSVGSYLRYCGLRVPDVMGFDADAGIILLEDLGDSTFLLALKGVSTWEEEKKLYQQAIDLLLDFQFFTKKFYKRDHHFDLNCFHLKFDYQKLMWEVNFTLEQCFETYLKKKVHDQDREIIYNQLGKLCHLVSQEPVVLTHRDFHSKNIMIKDQEFVLIDFQDARMGPIQYDLVSLLKDSYHQLTQEQVSELVEYYLQRHSKISVRELDSDRFEEVFDLVSIQRNFKAIGSFAYFFNHRKIPLYLKYIGNTFENIIQILMKYPDYYPLREVIFRYYHF